MRGRTGVGIAVVAAILVLGACGHEHSDVAADEHSHSHDHSTDHDMDVTYAFGEPGEAADADRQVEIAATDPFAFDPDELDAAEGETITFIITNEGSSEHEFVLGDSGYQGSYGDHEGDHGANGVHLDVGDTASLTWTFGSAGEVEYACHVSGHYEAGMVGTIAID